ncbi:hypothetical protein ACFYL6_00370 [Micromonospora sp. NPDC007208]|uniref:hypothetical protein n=1 Tax=Micromonospora sp. NPDC007208 TaxID=3364236 RepID=UPI0036C25DC8
MITGRLRVLRPGGPLVLTSELLGVAVMLLPVAALSLVIDSALAGWATSTMHMGHVVPLVPAHWAMLVLVAPVTFLAGALLVRRREETLRMVALVRDADREQPMGR